MVLIIYLNFGGRMKKFFKDYSYCIVKMLVNQIAIGIFGAMLSMATTLAGNKTLSLVVSVGAVLLYLFLIYTMTWEVGSKDGIAVEAGRKPKRIHLGLLLSLFANIPNFIIAILYAICAPFMNSQAWAGTINAIVKVLSLVLQGMYSGIMGDVVLPAANGEMMQLHYFWWSYFLIIVPALLVSWFAYMSGHRQSKFGALFVGPKKEKK